MKFTMEFECDNAAFEESPEREIAAILRRAAFNVLAVEFDSNGRVREGYRQTAPCLDTNGNTVGRWRITDEEG